MLCEEQHHSRIVTEIVEFAARLCEKGVYRGGLTVSIEVKHIKGFLLVGQRLRPMVNYYAASNESLGNEWRLDSEDLITQSKHHSLEATRWFFERFGWLNLSDQVFRGDQENFLNRPF